MCVRSFDLGVFQKTRKKKHECFTIIIIIFFDTSTFLFNENLIQHTFKAIFRRLLQTISHIFEPRERLQCMRKLKSNHDLKKQNVLTCKTNCEVNFYWLPFSSARFKSKVFPFKNLQQKYVDISISSSMKLLIQSSLKTSSSFQFITCAMLSRKKSINVLIVNVVKTLQWMKDVTQIIFYFKNFTIWIYYGKKICWHIHS